MKVAKIEYAGKASVFNMEVEGTHSFVVNDGIVAHNCYDALRYLLVMHPTPKRIDPAPVVRGYDPLSRD